MARRKRAKPSPQAWLPKLLGWAAGVRREAALCAVIAAVTLIVYWPTLHYGFIGFDDPDYVVDNVHVQQGFTGNSLVWAFTTDAQGNWHPLTWLSHMLDCKCFGLHAGRTPCGEHGPAYDQRDPSFLGIPEHDRGGVAKRPGGRVFRCTRCTSNRWRGSPSARTC